MQALSNGSSRGTSAHANGHGNGSRNGSSIVSGRTTGTYGASTFLLGHIERLSRELGHIDNELDSLSARATALEQRLEALERGQPLEAPALAEPVERASVAVPELIPPRFSSELAPSGLVKLLSRLETLGQQVGRTESELDVAREEDQPMSAPVLTLPPPVVEIAEPAIEPLLPEKRVIEYPTVAVVVSRRSDEPTFVTETSDESRADFAVVATSPPAAVLRKIQLPEPAADVGPPLQIPASEIFAPSEAYRAFPVRVEAEDEVVPATKPPATPKRHRRRVLLTAAVVAIVIFATLAGALALTRAADDEETPSEATFTIVATTAATVPPAAATLQPVNGGQARLPGIYSMIASSTAGAGGNPAGIIGSTRAQVEELLGPVSGTRPGGATSYLDDTVAVSFSADGLALRVGFSFIAPGNELDQAGAQRITELYRPLDAQNPHTSAPAANISRVTYTSATLASVFDGSDTGGRDAGSYTEELHIDTATGLIYSIMLSLGDAP